MSNTLLMKEYKDLQREKWVSIDVRHTDLSHIEQEANYATYLQLKDNDIYTWDLALIVIDPDSLYYGGYFKARMTFPKDYPYQPPGTPPTPSTRASTY